MQVILENPNNQPSGGIPTCPRCGSQVRSNDVRLVELNGEKVNQMLCKCYECDLDLHYYLDISLSKRFVLSNNEESHIKQEVD